ncbi:MAG: Asp-tRNA(Asn)/Glu-tRNA(Gln) amidotransferase subunit GatC [Candidatus Gracilibacteria bacterium]|nr:Asp-tRNA(Asn)/Glu-tRNA(Gln) amidotransferase subunit GatC [bacterium]MDZ4217252.1 Asp-tRNA(Asn)/Glu-tRNA(Gln) amidotransferase subunit GatC [Candidatus Gracilibacteria bacterium]
MALTKDDVRHVAKLARLHLTDEELDRFTGQLGSIFHHLDTLAEVDTDGVEETAQVNGLVNVDRDDPVLPSLDREDVLKTSERENERGMIKVRKSI